MEMTPYERRKRRYRSQDRLAISIYVAFWVGVASLIVWAFISFHHVQERCDAKHGVLVRGAGLKDWGYNCIERGMH